MKWQRRTFFLKRLWIKYVKSHFFNKAFLIFLLIGIAASVLLLFVLSENLITIKTEQALDMSNQILDTVESYLQQKITAAYSIHQRFIRDSDNWSTLISHLKYEGESGMAASRYASLRQSMGQTIYAVDSQFYGLFIYGDKNREVMRLSNGPDSNDKTVFLEWAKSKNRPSGAHLLIARNPAARNNAFSFLIVNTINDPDTFTTELGAMGLSFSAMNLKQSYRPLENHLKGSLFVVNGQGELLFDSHAAYQETNVLNMAIVADLKNGSRRVDNAIYNVSYNDQGEFYVVNPIPVASVMNDVEVVRRSIQTVIIIVLLAALLLTYSSSRILSHRLRSLTDTMKQVRNGVLTGFTDIPQSHDEIGVLHTEFLNVCQSLDEHIKREYVYQLKQKEMEYYALQAQINPHFLYNSLEAIRMKLLLSSQSDASRMIRILSEMFRNMMKQDKVVMVRDEMTYLQSYLELFKFRLGDKLEYKLDADEKVYQYASVKHILQPLVENALVHGFADLATADKPGLLTISAKLEGSDILFTISDNGEGITPEKLQVIKARLHSKDLFQESVGIYNVNNRLRIIYGEHYRLHINSGSDGTKVSLRMKAMTKKELEAYVQGAAS